VRVAESVDRLLSVADNEDRRTDGIVGDAESFAPAPDQLQDEIPLRAARVLEFVDEHVPMARFEPQTALRELVEVLQQRDRAIEKTGKIHEAVRVERPLILRQRD